jgi:hypothetical protein
MLQTDPLRVAQSGGQTAENEASLAHSNWILSDENKRVSTVEKELQDGSCRVSVPNRRYLGKLLP